jgi:type VI protein secretion system component VasF
MDHQEEHHLHHRKEREHEKHLQHERERRQEDQLRVIHPAWFLVLGVVLVLVATAIWTIFFI